MIISENDKIQDIISGLETAYIDSNINSNLAYRPEFISNDYKKGKKVLVSIENYKLRQNTDWVYYYLKDFNL